MEQPSLRVLQGQTANPDPIAVPDMSYRLPHELRQCLYDGSPTATQLRQNCAVHQWQALTMIARKGKHEPTNRKRTEATILPAHGMNTYTSNCKETD